MGLGVIGEEGRVQFLLTRMIYMWHNLRCTCLSRSRALSSTGKFVFAALRRFGKLVSNISIGRQYVLGLQRWFKGGCRGMGEGHRGASRRRVGPVRCLPASPWTAGAPVQSPAASALVVQGWGSSAALGRDDRWTPTQSAMENFTRETAHRCPSES